MQRTATVPLTGEEVEGQLMICIAPQFKPRFSRNRQVTELNAGCRSRLNFGVNWSKSKSANTRLEESLEKSEELRPSAYHVMKTDGAKLGKIHPKVSVFGDRPDVYNIIVSSAQADGRRDGCHFLRPAGMAEDACVGVVAALKEKGYGGVDFIPEIFDW